MLKKVTDYGYTRNIEEAIVFYLVYIVLGVLFKLLLGSIARVIKPTVGFSILIIEPLIIPLILSVLILKEKELEVNFKYVTVALIGLGIAFFYGVIFGLLPISFLTTVEGVKKNKKNDQNLIDAVKKEDSKEVKKIISNQGNVNKKDNNEWTPLIWAAARGNREITNLLVENGAQVNYKNEAGINALMAAVSSGDIKTVQILLEAGADIKSKNKDGKTAQKMAKEAGNTKILKILTAYK